MKLRKRLMKRMISIILTFVMVVGTGLGIVPRSTITAKAETDEVVSIYMQNGFPDGTLMKGESKWNDNDGDNYYFDLSEGNYKLTGDIATKFEIRVKGNVTLDLNGFGIFYKSDYEPVIRIIDNGNLTIIDKNPNTEHYITLSNGRASHVSVVENIQNGDEQTNQSVIKVNGGYITGGAGKYGGSVTYGGGVFVDNGELNLKGGTVAGNSAARGAGIYIAENGKVNIEEGAAISHNRAASMGAGIYVDATSDARGSLNMTGGTISENTFTDSAYGYGGGVYLAGDFTMSGGTISNHDVTGTSGKNGAGVYIGNNSYLAKATNGRFTMTGGTIENNTAQLGGGVIVNTDLNYKNAAIKPTFTLSGGSIINNVAKYTGSGSNAGGGIYISQNESCTFNLSGSPVISGNKLIKGNNEPVDDNIFAGLGITIVGQLDISNNKKPFGVSQSEYNISNYTITKGWSVYNEDKNPWDYFTSELAKYYVDEKSQSDVTEALFAPLWSIEVSAPSGIKHKEDSGAETQLVKSGNPQPIDDVIYTADEDHYFQENYTSGVIYSNTYSYPAASFSVTRDSNSQITISGTPVGATKITLPAPTEKAAQETPAAPEAETIGLTSITLKTVEGCEYGRKSDTGDEILWQDSPAFTDLTKATQYTFYQRVKGDDTHKNSEPSEAVISTLDHTHDWSFEANGATITATCADTDRNHGDNKTATLTLKGPELKSFGGEGSPEATITGSIDGVTNPSIVYKKGTETLENAPKDSGTYTASITLGNATASLEYTIAKATAPTLTGDQKPEAKSGLKYKETETGTGTKQPLVTAPTADAPSGYTVKYSLDGNDWSEEIPTGKDAGAYTVKVKYEGDNNHEDFNGEDIAVTIAKADQSKPDAAPTATDENIGSNSITLNTVEGCEYGIKSGDSDVIVWQESPTFTGLTKTTEYTFYQRCAEDTNHNASPESESATIKTSDHSHDWSFEANGATITATCADTDRNHGDNKTATLTLKGPELKSFGGEGSPEATITGSVDGVTNPSIVYKKGTETLTAAPTDAGTYTASITLGTATASLEYTIAKATAPTLTDDQKPTAKTGLKYDETSGESGQELVNAPTPAAPFGYAVKYSLDGENWSEEIPTGKDAGDYTVKVKYEGDNNHEDFNGTDIEVTIAKADQNKPDAAPTATVENIGSNSITLNTVEGCEYGIKSGESDEIKWQESPTFTGLTKSTEYTFYQRCEEDTNHNASLPSEGTTIKTSDHEHDWSFAAEGATITATCDNTDGGHGENKTAALTINVPELTTFGGKESPEVTITGNIDGVIPSIVYKKGNDILDKAPTDAGDYTVEVTVGEGDKAVTAKVSYKIAQAETTVSSVPTASAITYGQKLSDSNLTGGDETGTFTWKAPETVPTVSDSNKTEYEVIFTPKDTNYKAATCKVKVTVNKAAGKTTSADAVKTANASSVSASDGKLNFDGKNTYQYSADDGVTWTDVKDATSVSVKAGTYKIRVAGDENYEPGEPITVKVSADTPVSEVSVKADTVNLENVGATVQIEAKVTPDNATNKKLTYSSSDTKVATVDENGKITAVANGSATITVKSVDGNKTAVVIVTVAIPETTKPTPQAASVVTPEEEEKAALAMNEGLKISQTESEINIRWGKVDTADGYDVYVQYCGSNFKKEPTAKTDKTNVTKVKVKKINGKKLNLKKNYKIYIEAYKLVDDKKVSIAKTITGHIVGRKNTAYTNVKMIKLAKSKYTVTAGKTAKIKAKTVLVDKRKKQLSNAHATQFRYASSDEKIATVSKKGKIKGIAKGQCTVYVYARNGYARKITVTVK